MASVNKVHLIGNLGGDPEIRYTQGGKAVANFSLAINEKRGDREHTEWVRVVVWEKTAEAVAQYLSKGSLAFVEGRLVTREWTTDAGEKKKATEVVAFNVQFLDSRRGADDRPPPRSSESAPAIPDTDIPF